MEENKPDTKVRPTKRQFELLSFIETFIAEHGYSPSYREIMTGLNYTSVATVALHVNNLIKRGHLQKRDRSARSLEVITKPSTVQPKVVAKQLKEDEEKWLVEKIEQHFKDAESTAAIDKTELEKLHSLVEALRVLGAPGAAQAFNARLSGLKKKSEKYSV